MKKIKGLSILLCLVLMVTAFAGCGKEKNDITKDTSTTKPTKEEIVLPDDFPMEMSFLSGAGGWSTNITIKKDGTFVGVYSDSEMGSMGPDYPNGTVYICEFSGEFDIIEKIDETSYYLKLVDIEVEDEGTNEWIEDGIKYIVSEPFGLESGEDFILYTPDKKTEDLSEEFLMWWPLRYGEEEYSTLSVYGLHNLETDYGFFGQIY